MEVSIKTTLKDFFPTLSKAMRLNDTYNISQDGKVTNSKTKRILKTHLVRGYETLRLGKGKKYYIHRLVASVFLPSPTEEGCVVDHIDRNKLNNNASNLRWCSQSVNCKNRSIELKARNSNMQGEHHIKRIMALRQINPTFAVVYNTTDFKYYSSHKTMEEAIEKRNSLFI